MARSPDSLAFAERLKQALTRSRRRIQTPSQLAQQFNLHYRGNPITNQAAQKWLVGDNKPAPDKIETLAQMLGVSLQWLRYGIAEVASPSTPRTPRPVRPEDISGAELTLLARYRHLSAHQQHLVSELVEQLCLDRQVWGG